ncbi:helix-turn-helix domain-containing protein [Sphingomonas sp. MS122]|uniref:helix-turn-helix domain-containing protein n=1 Tax=Sphingomonas sp. MS122 TaxID=3412683 RepID=UPI003C2DA626
MQHVIQQAASQTIQPVGEQLRHWRARRRLSQLDLAMEAGISQRHLSFVESGRSRPGRDMVLLLAESLELPLRERNRLLLGAGHAPHFAEHALEDEALADVREAMLLILKGHEPFPALVVDRAWNLVAHNDAVGPLLVGVAPWLLARPCNVLKLSLHREGLGPRIVNYGEWRAHILSRLRHEAKATGDPAIETLLAELEAMPSLGPRRQPPAVSASPVVPLKLRSEAGELSFLSTTTVFGTPQDVTLSELAIEAFYPADAATRAALSR